jgi:hypothetical protein
MVGVPVCRSRSPLQNYITIPTEVKKMGGWGRGPRAAVVLAPLALCCSCRCALCCRCAVFVLPLCLCCLPMLAALSATVAVLERYFFRYRKRRSAKLCSAAAAPAAARGAAASRASTTSAQQIPDQTILHRACFSLHPLVGGGCGFDTHTHTAPPVTTAGVASAHELAPNMGTQFADVLRLEHSKH